MEEVTRFCQYPLASEYACKSELTLVSWLLQSHLEIVTRCYRNGGLLYLSKEVEEGGALNDPPWMCLMSRATLIKAKRI